MAQHWEDTPRTGETVEVYEVREPYPRSALPPVVARPLGVLLIAGALFGWLLSVAGLIAIWPASRSLNEDLGRVIDLTDRSLETTRTGLDIVSTSLDETRASLALMKQTSDEASLALNNTTAVFEDFARLAGEDFLTVINSTQTSLSSAQTSARLIDDTLASLSRIPLIGSAFRGYQPEIPLNVAVGDVSESLATLPDSLVETQKGLNTTAQNFENIRQDFETLSANIDEIDQSLSEAESVVTQYQGVVGGLQGGLGTARESLTRWLRIATLIVAAVLVWMLIASAGLISQGLNLLKQR